MLLIELAAGSQVAGVFTRNRFCAAPVHLSRAHLASGQPIRALVVNTGNANAGTGETAASAPWPSVRPWPSNWAARPSKCCRSRPA